MATDENGNALCVVCEKRRVAHEHVICRSCNRREYYDMLMPEEKERLMAELQYRIDNP